MTTRLVTTDLAAAGKAADALPAAMRRYASASAAAVIRLDDIPDGAPPSHALVLLAKESAQRKTVNDARADVLMLLADAGVPVRVIAEAMGMHHATVSSRIRDAVGKRIAAQAQAEAEADRVADFERRERDRARQEREAQAYSNQAAAEYRARREGR